MFQIVAHFRGGSIDRAIRTEIPVPEDEEERRRIISGAGLYPILGNRLEVVHASFSFEADDVSNLVKAFECGLFHGPGALFDVRVPSNGPPTDVYRVVYFELLAHGVARIDCESVALKGNQQLGRQPGADPEPIRRPAG